MRYACMRLKNGEIRQNYYFFAGLRDKDREISSNEGSLEWVNLSDLENYKMPHTAKVVLHHYAKEGRFTEDLYGCLTTEEGAIFTPLKEFGD